MKEKKMMIYGAYGYTGELIVNEALKRGLKPVIAGRSAEKLASISNKTGLEYRAFTVEDGEQNLQNIGILLNCAGPFSATALVLAKACIKQKIHYLDITGEIDIFKKCYELEEEAKNQNVVIMPGVGFDIVPTDCLAAILKEKMPDAESIEIAFSLGTMPSVGTMKTFVENIGKGCLIMENHLLKTVPNAYKMKKVPFQNGLQWAITIPWGDVFTAGISTNIPNISVYMTMPKTIIYIIRLVNPFKSVFNLSFVQKLTKKFIDIFFGKQLVEDSAEKERSQCWGEATSLNGNSIAVTISTPSAYYFTAKSSIKIAQYCLNNNVKGGYYTPSMLLGSDFIQSIPDVTIQNL